MGEYRDIILYLNTLKKEIEKLYGKDILQKYFTLVVENCDANNKKTLRLMTNTIVLHFFDVVSEEFNKVCNILTEYGRGKAFTVSGEAYLKEHGELISVSALQQLVQL